MLIFRISKFCTRRAVLQAPTRNQSDNAREQRQWPVGPRAENRSNALATAAFITPKLKDLPGDPAWLWPDLDQSPGITAAGSPAKLGLMRTASQGSPVGLELGVSNARCKALLLFLGRVVQLATWRCSRAFVDWLASG